ncbi:MAG: AAA family ATPase, partial [Bacteroidota bacterium]|nr:AAA family ATPase [Bacteroidota bacterium]
MKIESIHIPATEAAQIGLREVKLSKMGNVVVIAGKNGSGKTRFLDLLQRHLKRILDIRLSKSENDDLIQGLQGSINEWVKRLQSLRDQIIKGNDEIQNIRWTGECSNLEEDIRRNERDIIELSIQKELLQNTVVIGKANLLKYVPINISLTDSNTLTPNQLQEYAGYASQPSMERLPLATLAKIQAVQTKWFYATHQAVEAPNQEKQQAIAEYERLKETIKQFLGAELGIDLNGGRATLFGKPLGQVNFSQGQRVLLQFCIALYSQGTALSELVLLLDEPENHLHPAALNYVLDRLRSVVTNGQIWIATHSINVLAHFQEETLLYMEDGAISYAGNDTLRVLEGLLGDEEERERMARFLSLPFVMSGMRFASESLLGAAVVMTGAADPQMRQIREALAAERAAGTGAGKLKVLDFGAGKGRLIASLHEQAAAEPESEPLADWLDYVAYDPFATNAAECRDNIARAYGNADRRYYNDLKPLREQQSDGTFDQVILTNVFHEIPPGQWLDILKQKIQKLLKPTGRLIIVEDQRLPHGEQAHEYGFLLFDTLEFVKLFAITADDKQAGKYACKAEDKDRLKAHYFAPELLDRVTAATRLA